MKATVLVSRGGARKLELEKERATEARWRRICYVSKHVFVFPAALGALDQGWCVLLSLDACWVATEVQRDPLLCVLSLLVIWGLKYIMHDAPTEKSEDAFQNSRRKKLGSTRKKR